MKRTAVNSISGVKIILFIMLWFSTFDAFTQTARIIKARSMNKIEVEIGRFIDISNDQNYERESSFQSSLQLALSIYPNLIVTKADYQDLDKKEKKAKGSNDRAIKISGEFAIVQEDIQVFITITDPGENRKPRRLETIKNAKINTMQVLQDAASLIMSEIKKRDVSNSMYSRSLALVPMQLSMNSSEYLKLFVKDLIVHITDNLEEIRHINVLDWEDAQQYYFSGSDPDKLMDKLGVDAMILFEFETESSGIVLMPHLLINDESERIALPEYVLEGDDDHRFLTRAFNNLFDQIIDDEGIWHIEPLIYSSDDYEDYIQQADFYRLDKNYLMSNYMYYKAMRLNSNIGDIHFNLGTNYHDLAVEAEINGEFDLMPGYIRQAKKRYYKAIELDSMPEAMFALGHLLLYEANNDQALQWYLKVHEIDSLYPNIHYYLGKGYYWTKKYDEAFDAFAKCLPGDEKYTESQYYLGICKQAQNDFEASLKYLKYSCALDTENENYKYSLGYSYFRIGTEYSFDESYEKALEYYNIAGEYSNYYYLHENKRLAYLHLHHFVEAEKEIVGGIESQSFDEKKIYFTHGSDLASLWFESDFKDENLYRNAVKNYKDHLKYVPDDAYTYSRLGALYVNHGNFEKGMANMEKGLELDSMDLWAGVNLLEVYLVRSKYEKCVDLYDYLMTKDSLLDNDQKTMSRFLAFIAKEILEKDNKSELKYLIKFYKSDRIVESWYWNLYDEWFDTANIGTNARKLLNYHTTKMKEKTIKRS